MPIPPLTHLPSLLTILPALLLLLLHPLPTTAAIQHPLSPSSQPHPQPLPPSFLLAGDSTTAPQNPLGGGWGNGFLSTLHHGAHGTNFGRNGATTASFIASGVWGDVLERVVQDRGVATPYVTIAFGHNDHVALPFAQYVENLRSMGSDVLEAGGVPIYMTPLSQRQFSPSTGLLIDTLHAEREAVLSVAACFAAGEVFAVDLYGASMQYLNGVGEERARRYGLGEGDDTHLNGGGGVVFGNMVSGLVREGMGLQLGEWTWPNGTIWEAIGKGEFIFPDG